MTEILLITAALYFFKWRIDKGGEVVSKLNICKN
jgi:hypothetical protein